MNWLTAICTWIWLTKERIKAAWMRRRINRDVDRLANSVRAGIKPTKSHTGNLTPNQFDKPDS